MQLLSLLWPVPPSLRLQDERQSFRKIQDNSWTFDPSGHYNIVSSSASAGKVGAG